MDKFCWFCILGGVVPSVELQAMRTHPTWVLSTYPIRSLVIGTHTIPGHDEHALRFEVGGAAEVLLQVELSPGHCSWVWRFSVRWSTVLQLSELIPGTIFSITWHEVLKQGRRLFFFFFSRNQKGRSGLPPFYNVKSSSFPVHLTLPANSHPSPVPDASGLPVVHVRVEGGDDGILQGELDAEVVGDLRQEGHKTIGVNLQEMDESKQKVWGWGTDGRKKDRKRKDC